MNKKIKIEGTRVGADGTGYWRGSDGKFYYGNPSRNGYVTETLEEQQKRMRAEEARRQDEAAKEARKKEIENRFIPQVRPEPYTPVISDSFGPGICIVFLLTVVIDVLYAVMAGSLILAWPYHLQDLYYTYLDSYIMDNRIYRWALLKSVVTLGVIGLFVYECRMILRARKDITLEFNYQIRVALFAGVSVVVFAIMYLLLPDGKFSFFGVIACLFKGVSMAFMPALLMYALGYHLYDHWEPTLIHLAKGVCRWTPGHRGFYIYMGIANLIFFLFMMIVYIFGSHYSFWNAVSGLRGLIELGAFCLILSIVGRGWDG